MRLQDIVAIVLLFAMAAAIFAGALGMAAVFPAQDLAQYWAAAHLVRQNPYSLQQVTAFERAAGCPARTPPLVLRVPPWILPLLLPFALLSYRVAYAAWAVLTIAVVAGCARALWKLGSAEPSLAPAFLSLMFGPTVCLLILGQIAVLELLGVTLFLVFLTQRRDVLAGAALLLVLLKPHVVLLFLIAVLLWTLRCRRWGVLISAVCATVLSSLVALVINPGVFAYYGHFAAEYVRETRFCPNLGGMLYLITGRHIFALLPSLAGILWLAFYWRRRRAAWDWKTDGALVLLVSLVSAYYSFPYDELLALPALVTAYANGNRRLFLLGFAATNLGYAFYIGNFAARYGFDAMFLFWTSSAWLLTYLMSRPRPVPAPALAPDDAEATLSADR